MKNNKVTLIWIVIITLIILSIGCAYMLGKNVIPEQFKTSYIELEDSTIDDSLDNTKILYLTDLQFGNFMDQKRIKKLSNIIDGLDYDIVLFSGDLFDSNYQPTQQDIDCLVEFFASMKCPLGKFYIYGEKDLESNNNFTEVNLIFNSCNFELLNQTRKIHNGTDAYFYLTGINIDDTSSIQIPIDQFSLGFVHDINSYEKISQQASFVLCGNSHTRQVNLPFIDPTYSLGKKENLYVSNGLGTTEDDFRLFSNPEIVILTIKKG